MALYKLTQEMWLEREVTRVKSALLANMEKGREYTVDEVLDLLAGVGLIYDNPAYQLIGQALIQQGIIEAIV